MKAHIWSPLFGLIIIATGSTLAVGSASAQSVLVDYQCACKKKPKVKKDVCKTTSTPSVTIKSSAKSKALFREKAASTKCYNKYKAACPIHSCAVTVTQVGPEQVLTPAMATRRKDASKAGMTGKQAEALAKYADEKNLTIIVRDTNSKSRDYQDKDRSKYRPKPLALSALKTAKSGRNGGLIVKPNMKKLDSDQRRAVQAELRELEKACRADKDNNGVDDKNEAKGCGWSLNKDGVVRDPTKRFIYADYNLQGVYDKTKLVETNADTSKGEKRLEEMNDALDSSRTDDRDQWLFQHGANDNYKNDDGSMGRYPDPKETFLIFKDDGSTQYIRSVKDLKKYYEDNKLGKKPYWPYEK